MPASIYADIKQAQCVLRWSVTEFRRIYLRINVRVYEIKIRAATKLF